MNELGIFPMIEGDNIQSAWNIKQASFVSILSNFFVLPQQRRDFIKKIDKSSRKELIFFLLNLDDNKKFFDIVSDYDGVVKEIEEKNKLKNISDVVNKITISNVEDKKIDVDKIFDELGLKLNRQKQLMKEKNIIRKQLQFVNDQNNYISYMRENFANIVKDIDGKKLVF